MTILTVRDVDLAGKRVLVRVDFNVPLNDRGEITDDTRIKEELPTIRYVLMQCPRQLILMSHLGRPDGEVVPGMSLAPVAARLSELLLMTVALAPDCLGPVPADRVVLLENLRFHPEEELDGEEFARKLSECADIYVDDAFGTAHRAHASNHAIAGFLPGCMGLLMEKEVMNLRKLEKPQRPYIAIIGGAKADKLAVVESLEKKVDFMIFGGTLANTMLKGNGIAIGRSKFDPASVEFAKGLLARSRTKILLPVDVVVAREFKAESNSRIVDIGEIPEGWMIMDIGPQSIELYTKTLRLARTVTWTGPIGVFEFAPFAVGTQAIAQVLASIPATTIIGGGDSGAAVTQMGLAQKMSLVSTGGGATLEFISGREMPAIKALEENFGKFKDLLRRSR